MCCGVFFPVWHWHNIHYKSWSRCVGTGKQTLYMFTERENGFSLIRGEVHFAMPTPFALCQNPIINSSDHFWGAFRGDFRHCGCSLAVIKSASMRRNTWLIVITDAKTESEMEEEKKRKEKRTATGRSPQRSHHVCRMTLAWTRLFFFLFFNARAHSCAQSTRSPPDNKPLRWKNEWVAPSESELCRLYLRKERTVSPGEGTYAAKC